MRRLLPGLLLLLLLLLAAACQEEAAPAAAQPAPGPRCTGGLTTCEGGRFLRCSADGSGWDVEAECRGEGETCDRTRGCVHWLEVETCGAGEGACDETGLPWHCTDGGVFERGEPCPEGTACGGQGVCLPCDPRGSTCIEGDSWRCREDHTGFERLDVCDPRVTRCVDGECVSLCALPDREPSHRGCRFWAVDLDNLGAPVAGRASAAERPVAVAVGNVADDRAARVTVRASDGVDETQVAEAKVPPSGVEVLELPGRDVRGATRDYLAFRIDSDVPVVAVQLGPGSVDGASADASLLLPQAALGEDHVVVTGDAWTDADGTGYGAFVVVVGTTAEQVEVTVEPTAEVEVPAGATQQGGTVRARLAAYEVLALPSRVAEARAPGAGNLSGTRVRATGPVAVLAGNAATAVPQGGEDERCCADHLEEQFPPLSAWGTRTVAAGALPRDPYAPEGDVWRVTAGAQAADLRWAPSRPQGAPAALAARESVEFETVGDLLLESSAPVLLVHFVQSSRVAGEAVPRESCDPATDRGQGPCTLSTGVLSACGTVPGPGGRLGYQCAPVGDPAMTIVPPVGAYGEEHVFVTPPGYEIDFVSVLAPVSARLLLDGEALAGPERIAADGEDGVWGRVTFPVADGPHRLSSSEPAAVLVLGYDRDVAYGFPAGLELTAGR